MTDRPFPFLFVLSFSLFFFHLNADFAFLLVWIKKLVSLKSQSLSSPLSLKVKFAETTHDFHLG